MVSRIILLFTLGLMASMTLPATATPHSQVKPREFNSDNITPASSSILVLNTTGASILSAIVDSGAGYAYFGTSATPAQVFKVRLSDFTNVANLTLGGSANAALAASAAILDPIHEIAYFGTLNGQIVKVDLSTFTNVTVVHPGLGGITAGMIDPAAGFGYFGTSTGNILKMRLSDLTLNQTLTPTPSNTTITLAPSHSIDSAVIDPANGYAYFGDSGCSLNIFCTPSPNVVVKVRLSDFSIVSELDAAEDSLTSAGIDTSGGYIYFGGANLAGSQIVRFSLTDLSKKQVLAPAPAGAASNFVLDPSRGIGYAIAGGSLAPFRLSDFNQIAEEYLQNNIFNTRLGVLDPATGYSYFAASTFQFPLGQQGIIIRIPPSTLPSNDFSLEASPSRVSFQEGGVGAAYIVVRSNSYTGTISFSILISSGYVLQPVAHLLQTTVTLETNGDNSTILAISAPNQDDIPASDFAITVTGSSGTISRSISIEVTITPGPSHFLPIINPPSLATNPYSNYSSIALVTHTGFSGTVNFTATITPNPPNAPTAKVNPSSVTENLPKETYTDVSWVFVSANSTTAAGQYEVDVTAASGNETHTAQLCVLVIPHGAMQFCLLSDPHSLILGPGQTRTTLITQYMPHPPFNASMYLRTIDMTTSIVSGPSPTALQATLNPSTFPLPYVLPGPQQLETTLTVSASPIAAPGNYVLRISSTNGTITGTVDIPVTITAAPVSSIPGVFPGDWAQYQVSATWNSTPAGLPAIPDIARYLRSYEAVFRVGATVGNETAGLLSTAYLNGTVNVQEVSGNTFKGSPTLFPLVVGSSLTFNTTTTSVFAGASRLTTTLKITSSASGVTATGTWTWDYQTGILLEYRLTVQGTGNLGTITGQVHVRLIDTNLWTPTEPYFTVRPSSPFLTAQQYTATSSKISVTSLNNFSGSVTMTAQGIPSDLSVSLSINSTLNIHADQTSNATLIIHSGVGHFLILVNATNGLQFHLALLEITVVPVTPPTVTISAGPNPANTGEPVTLNFTIHSDLAALQVTIDWGDGTITNPDPTMTTVTHVYTSAEFAQSHTYVIDVNVTSLAGQGFSTVSETVNDRGPTLAISDISPNPANTGQSVALSYAVSDPDGIVQATWVDWGDGSVPDLIFNMTSGSMCQRLNANLDSNACTLAQGDLLFSRPQDPATITNGSIIIFRPYPATPSYLVAHRVVKIISPADSVYNQITFWTEGDANAIPDVWDLANAGIPASQVLAVYQYTLPPPGTPSARYDTHRYPSVADLQSQTFTIRVNATDDSGLAIFRTASETIIDRPPVLDLSGPSPAPANTGQIVTISLSASDPDGTVSSISVNWGDGSSLDILSASATSDTHSYNRAGSFTITVTATDSSGSSSHLSSLPFAVTAPSAPAVPAATILGFAPVAFYSLITMVVAAIGASTFLALRRMSKRTA